MWLRLGLRSLGRWPQGTLAGVAAASAAATAPFSFCGDSAEPAAELPVTPGRVDVPDINKVPNIDAWWRYGCLPSCFGWYTASPIAYVYSSLTRVP